MKLIAFIFVLLTAASAIGQITLDRNNFPHAGDTTTIADANSLSVDYQATGPNYLWDFSSLSQGEPAFEVVYDINYGGYILNIQFGNFAPEKYKADMLIQYDALPLEQIVGFLPIDIPIENIYQVLKSDEEKINVVGYSIEAMGQQLGFKSDTIETAYNFPSKYLDTFTTKGYTKFNLNPIVDIEIKQHRERTTVVDGYGEIHTPFNQYKNALRLHHKIVEENDIKLPIGDDPIWLPINRTINEYEWWIDDYKRPVCKIITQGTMGVEIPTNISFVYDLRDPYEHLGDHLFPNPSNGHSIVHTINELLEVAIYDLEGRLVKTIEPESPDTHFINMDVSDLAAGRYTVIAKTSENKKVIFRYIVL